MAVPTQIVPWFTWKEEKPDIGTVIFKADDYYEKLEHITGMWNDDKYLFASIKSPEITSDEDTPKPVDPNTIFKVRDIQNVPQLLAYLDRANMKQALHSDLLDFMWDLYKIYVRKMSEFGYAAKWMSKREFTMLENREKWNKLTTAMRVLRIANEKEEARVFRRKRMLKPTKLRTFPRLEDLDHFKINKDGTLVPVKPAEREMKHKMEMKRKSKLKRKSTKRKSKAKSWKSSRDFDGTEHGSKDIRSMYKALKKKPGDAFYSSRKPEGPYDWDYGKTRLFDRKHVRKIATHFEFTRIYQKLSKSLRFSHNEPVDWRTITVEEIDKHRYTNDCWMAIKGRVYDVTNYLAHHPGGSDFIMQGAGIDATYIFSRVHPYVVFYQHLAGKQIGTLPNYEEHPRTEWEPTPKFSIFGVFKDWWHRPKHPLAKWNPKRKLDQNDTEYIYSVHFPSGLVSREEDWTLTIIDGFQVTIMKTIEAPHIWYGGFDLRTKVMDDTVYRTFSQDFNSVEIRIAKSYKIKVKHPVRDWRQNDGFFLSSFSLKEMYRCSVVERKAVVDGVKLYGISLGMNKFLGCPIGWYVNLRILDETRPYTPICLPDEFEEKFKDESGDFQTLFFIIKEFKDGNFTSMLHHLPTKKILEGVDIYMSPPMGNFKLDFLFEDVDVILLIAGGTGISVMTRIIQEYVSKAAQMRDKIVCLLHFAQYREDLIWKQVWMDLTKRYQWFRYFFSLSRIYRYTTVRKTLARWKRLSRSSLSEGSLIRGSGSSAGSLSGKPKKAARPVVLESDPNNPQELYGYPSVSKMVHVFSNLPGADKRYNKHKAIVCGPFGFNHSCKRMLETYGRHKKENIYCFAG